MKKSETISLVCIAVGAAVGFGLWHWVPFIPGWMDCVVGAAVAATVFREYLRIEANKSVVDSKAINRT
jgi:uncharacterized membrane protein YdjX (TVP38/TMEM64 family)